MPGNIEIKAKIADFNGTVNKALEIADEHILLEQSDTFFGVKNDCRLKLRTEKDRDSGVVTSVLIAYQRPDITGPKFSHYVMTAVQDPETMNQVLEMSNGIQGKVEKRRDVFIVSRNNLKARVHVDDVKNLGIYLEFEVIVENDDQLEAAQEFAEYLYNYFEISSRDLIKGAYWDILQLKAQSLLGANVNVS